MSADPSPAQDDQRFQQLSIEQATS